MNGNARERTMTTVFDEATHATYSQVRRLLPRYKNAPGERRLYVREQVGGMAAADPALVEQEYRPHRAIDGSIFDWGWTTTDALLRPVATSFPQAQNKLGGAGAYGEADVDQVVADFIRRREAHSSAENEASDNEMPGMMKP